MRENRTKEKDNILAVELQANTHNSVPPKTARLKRNLPSLARACDRVGVSDRAAAAIVSAVLQDFGLISTEDLQDVVDKNKIRRARHRKRKILQGMDTNTDEALHSLYFDGRKDYTIKNVLKGGKWYRQKVVEEHISSLIEEPGSKYIGHVTPKSGSAQEVRSCLMYYLKNR